jgi:hypothetical protein
MFAFRYGHGGDLSEMLVSKGFGEFISLRGQPEQRQDRGKTVTRLRNLASGWQSGAASKII